MYLFYGYGDHRDLPSFPTRRSSDLGICADEDRNRRARLRGTAPRGGVRGGRLRGDRPRHGREEAQDRKSKRLNSSHANISYAVFCLKKKKLIKCCIILFSDISQFDL